MNGSVDPFEIPEYRMRFNTTRALEAAGFVVLNVLVVLFAAWKSEDPAMTLSAYVIIQSITWAFWHYRDGVQKDDPPYP